MSIENNMINQTTRENSITDIIESVALEQVALSQILSAESEKIKKVISLENVVNSDLLAVNDSVNKMIKSITMLELVLQSKLSLFESSLCQSEEKEESEAITNVEISVIPPDIGVSVIKNDNTDFELVKLGQSPNTGEYEIITTPNYPAVKVTLPEGTSLSGNIISIDYSVTTEGLITLECGTGDNVITINIQYYEDEIVE